jgi:hypothetical protein
MRYMLMMNVPAGSGSYQINSWPADAIQAHIRYMMDLNKELTSAGELIGAEGLAPPTAARLVRAGKGGEPVTDGPFPETKEFLVGYWIVDVASPERAYEIAAKASSAPDAEGVPLRMAIEMRQIMSINAPDA